MPKSIFNRQSPKYVSSFLDNVFNYYGEPYLPTHGALQYKEMNNHTGPISKLLNP